MSIFVMTCKSPWPPSVFFSVMNDQSIYFVTIKKRHRSLLTPCYLLMTVFLFAAVGFVTMLQTFASPMPRPDNESTGRGVVLAKKQFSPTVSFSASAREFSSDFFLHH